MIMITCQDFRDNTLDEVCSINALGLALTGTRERKVLQLLVDNFTLNHFAPTPKMAEMQNLLIEHGFNPQSAFVLNVNYYADMILKYQLQERS